jgi:hypothetical protein
MVLLFAASRCVSIADACQRLRKAPSDQAVRDALYAQLPSMDELQRRLNRALQSRLPKWVRGRRWPMALDIHDISYYGRPHKRAREVCRSKRKQGTSRFHRYATLCMLHRTQRFTIALAFVWKGDSNAQIVRRLLEQARAIGLWPRYLLLDRGFYGLEVVQCLKSLGCPFMMPVVHRGRRSKKPLAELKGTRRFLACRRSGFHMHMMRNRQAQAPVRICVACRWRRCRNGRLKRQRPLVFAFWGFQPSSAAWAREAYRKRFGIETSYRQMNQGRARTSSRNPALRLLLVGIALVLRNVWVYLHRAVFGRARGFGIELRQELLRFRTLLLILQRCIEDHLQCAETAQSTLGAAPANKSGP